MAADKDKVAAFFFGGPYQTVGHIEVGHGLAACLDAGGFGAVEYGFKVFLSLFLRSLVVVFVGNGIGGGHAIEAYRSGKRLGHVQGDDFSARFACKADTLVGSLDRKSTRLNSSHYCASRMPSSA